MYESKQHVACPLVCPLQVELLFVANSQTQEGKEEEERSDGEHNTLQDRQKRQRHTNNTRDEEESAMMGDCFVLVVWMHPFAFACVSFAVQQPPFVLDSANLCRNHVTAKKGCTGTHGQATRFRYPRYCMLFSLLP